MVPHYSGTTLDAQARYAAGAKQILENYLTGKAQDPPNVIVGLGKYETKACEFSFSFVEQNAYLQSCQMVNVKKGFSYKCIIYLYI